MNRERTKSVLTSLEELAEISGNPIDLNTEVHGPGDSAGLAYIRGLTDSNDIKNNLLRPLFPMLVERNISLEQLMGSIPEISPLKVPDLATAVDHLLQGRTIVFLADETDAVSFDTRGWLKHPPKEPQSELVWKRSHPIPYIILFAKISLTKESVPSKLSFRKLFFLQTH